MSLNQLSALLPLPEEELQQVLDYAATLSRPEAAEHFRNLLGDSPAAVDFISTFNSRRQNAAEPSGPTAVQPSPSAIEPVPKSNKGGKKKKAQQQLHTPAARKVEDWGPTPGAAYNKKNQEDDYIIGRPALLGLSSQPMSRSGSQNDLGSGTSTPPKQQQQQQQQQQQRTAAGYLISDATKGKSRSTPTSRSSTPKPSSGTSSPKPPNYKTSTAKVNITGGTPMAGALTAITDLDNAIRSLEMSIKPTLSDVASRRCNCNATRHPLLAAAPNCLSCGKIVCVKEGLGPCTFCGTPLLSAEEVQGMIQELRSERGREKMALDKEAHRRPEVAGVPAPFSQLKAAGSAASTSASPMASIASSSSAAAEAEAKALEHRDRLLVFQAQNARRTTVRDEAADFDVGAAMSGTGFSAWASPEERARELKRQQKLLREMEWNAKPEYERRRQVVSIDLVGGRVVKRMAAVERPPSPPEDEERGAEEQWQQQQREEAVLAETDGNARAGGAFSHNPLVGGLIKPVYDAKGKGAELEGRKGKAMWRRVQDDGDNEAVILDGGVYGHVVPEVVVTSGDEPECG